MNRHITPNCCPRARKAIFLALESADDPMNRTPRWYINSVKTDFDRDDTDYGYAIAKFCPFCGKELPEPIKRTPALSPMMTITDGGHYCNFCNERLNSCRCAPEEWAWASSFGGDLSRILTDKEFDSIINGAANNKENIIQQQKNDGDGFYDLCGCFNCMASFTAKDIEAYSGSAAKCPKCGKPTVLAGCHGWTIDVITLAAVQERLIARLAEEVAIVRQVK